jgi:coenzyme F420-reducing hydrogenase delta subunit
MPPRIISLVCERSCDLSNHVDENGKLKDVDGAYVVKYPCSGMIQPLQIEAALKAGAQGVIVTGCQLGDCYYREGNRMIRERILGDRPPGLKKAVDRRRVIGLWLSRIQPERFIGEVKEFSSYISSLPAEPAAAGAKAER